MFSNQQHGVGNQIQYSATTQNTPLQARNDNSQTYKQWIPDTKLENSGAITKLESFSEEAWSTAWEKQVLNNCSRN